MFVVIFFESQVWNPQRDRNATNCVVQKLILKRVPVQNLVLHAQVPRSKHRKHRYRQPWGKYLITHHSEHSEPIDGKHHKQRAPFCALAKQCGTW
jgi:hypothetical protein